jgi:hypothetical protein
MPSPRPSATHDHRVVYPYKKKAGVGLSSCKYGRGNTCKGSGAASPHHGANTSNDDSKHDALLQSRKVYLMKAYAYILSLIFMMFVSVQTSMAFIDPDATSASHEMEELATDIHDYLRHMYGPSFGAHDLEEAAGLLHDDLHDWTQDIVTESQIVEDMEALDAAWKQFRQTLNQEHLLNSGDEELDVLFDMNKHAYKELRFLLRQAK